MLLIVSASACGEQPPAMGNLSGRVVDPDGKSVAGARVAMGIFDLRTRTRKTPAECRTDADGRFRLGPVEPSYKNHDDLTVDADGFARHSIPRGSVSVYPGRDFDLITVRVDRGRVFTVQVLDVEGKPKPNAAVEPTVSRYQSGGIQAPTSSRLGR